MKRVFLFVLDSLGIGEMPDAAEFGDKNCNTLKRISYSDKFSIPNLIEMGIGNIEGVDFLPKTDAPKASVARLTERSKGKDTTTGHWEIAGIISDKPMPTYPNGFPQEILDRFSKAVGRGVLCNQPYSGTKAIMDYGREHLQSGKLIVYTSADSVFQIAAHESILSTQQLYKCCQIARKILVGEHAVGRVIARPFCGEYPNFVRTADRRDFSLPPPKETLLDAISKAGMKVCSIGKIRDIFVGQGITEYTPTHSNEEGMTAALMQAGKTFSGLCFINLVDFDMLYGHRQDIDGYAAALTEFDGFLPEFISKMSADDLLIITADHGCDPGDESTDHTREYTPLLIYGSALEVKNYGTRATMADVAATVAKYLDISFDCPGSNVL